MDGVNSVHEHNQPDGSESPERTARYQRQTIANTIHRIVKEPDFAWVAVGGFLDDWRQSAHEDRLELVAIGLGEPDVRQGSPEFRRWAAFCAAMVEWLCWQDQLPFPAWTNNEEYRLAEPWLLYPGELLRAWQLATTPVPFKMRNIFGGEQILDWV
jgi:hypothetical protein